MTNVMLGIIVATCKKMAATNPTHATVGTPGYPSYEDINHWLAIASSALRHRFGDRVGVVDLGSGAALLYLGWHASGNPLHVVRHQDKGTMQPLVNARLSERLATLGLLEELAESLLFEDEKLDESSPNEGALVVEQAAHSTTGEVMWVRR